MATSYPQSDRIFSLDVIRGVAVMGIFSVNIIAFAMIEAAYFNPAAYGGDSGADLFVWAANMLLIDNKMRSLFSILFGASMLLILERAEATFQSPASVHFRRVAVLLAIGLCHYFLIWWGDILVLYALSGAIAFLGWRKSAGQLVLLSILMLSLHLMLFAAVSFQAHADQIAAAAPGAAGEVVLRWQDQARWLSPSPQGIADDLRIHLLASGPMADKAAHWTRLIEDNLAFIPDTLALMFLGMAGYRCGFLNGQWSDRSYRLVAATLIPTGIAGAAAVAWVIYRSGFDPVTLMAGTLVVMVPLGMIQAIGYAALIVLLTRRQGWLSNRIAAAGRCAFTNYLGTSLIATFVFYGWGLGLYGSVSRAEAWLLVPCVWATMLIWSKSWLDRYRYGPLEWLWRSLSRGAPQPMR